VPTKALAEQPSLERTDPKSWNGDTEVRRIGVRPLLGEGRKFAPAVPNFAARRSEATPLPRALHAGNTDHVEKYSDPGVQRDPHRKPGLRLLLGGLVVSVAQLACDAAAPAPVGSGGNTQSGGTTAAGGTLASGGSQAVGGTSPTGGAASGGAAAGGTGGLTVAEASGGSGGSGGGSSGGAGSGGSGSGGSGSGGAPALPKFVGNITTFNSVDTDGLTYSDYWDQITPENAGKWGSVQGNIGSSRNWDTLDGYYDYAEDKGIVFKEHTFLWGPQQPSGSIGEADVKSWMTDFCQRYPNTRLIDVVNEPPPHTEPSYSNAIGGGTNGNWQWIVNAFTWAREACPNAILILNDYNNIEWGDQTDHFIDIVNTVLDAGGPIDAVGAQAHGLSGNAVSNQTMQTLITRLHDETGLPVYITEYDIDDNDDASQLAEYQAHMSFFLETEWIPGITVWGWIHGKTWVDSSGLIRNGSPRSAMTWLMSELGRPVPP